MVDSIRAGARAEPLGFTTTVLGASQLGVALPPDGRLDVLVAACARQPLWRCIGDERRRRRGPTSAARRRWGTIRPALGDVDDSALGLASFAASVAGYFGDADVEPQPMGGRPRVHPAGSRHSPTPSSGVSLSGGSAAGHDGDAAERPRHRRHRRLRAGQRSMPARTLRSQLSCTGDVVAGRAGRARRGCCAGDLASDLTEQLRSAGWDDAGDGGDPVPSASTMLALRAYWQDAA